MKRFNIRQIEAFRAVITLGSMTKAAELLGISQPAVSRLMIDFQDAVGFKLFRRQRSGAEATEDALRLYEQVERLFTGLEELNQQVHAIRTLTSGSITIAAMGLYANGILPDIIAEFRKRYPDIAIRLDTQAQNRIPEWISSRRADVGIVTLPISSTALQIRELITRPALCVFPADHPLATRAEITIDDLADMPFVSFPRGTPFRFEIDTIFDKAGVDRQMLTEATNHEAVCNLVVAGLGVSIVSPFSPHLRRDPALVFRPFRPAIPITIGMIADESDLSVAASAFHQFVLEQVERQTSVAQQAATK